jgi:hypothetical protein
MLPDGQSCLNFQALKFTYQEGISAEFVTDSNWTNDPNPEPPGASPSIGLNRVGSIPSGTKHNF